MIGNGAKFDSSVDRGEPTEFPLNGVIPGWTEALQKMKKGSVWELYIPSDLAYGERGSPRDQKLAPELSPAAGAEAAKKIEEGR